MNRQSTEPLGRAGASYAIPSVNVNRCSLQFSARGPLRLELVFGRTAVPRLAGSDLGYAKSGPDLSTELPSTVPIEPRPRTWSARMRTICMVVLLLAAVLLAPAQAQPALFVGYDDFCGVPVIVRPNPQSATAERDSLGRPVIHLDPGVMANWTMSRIFTLAHECGHHKLGHTTPGGTWIRNTQFWATRAQELEADCWAARALAANGYRRDLERVYIDYAYQGGVPPGDYPAGQERARIVARCASTREDAGWRRILRAQIENISDYRAELREDYAPGAIDRRCTFALNKVISGGRTLLADPNEPSSDDNRMMVALSGLIRRTCPGSPPPRRPRRR